jgi:hypothetical protein
VTLEGRIKRLELDWHHLIQPRPDPETVELWANLWSSLRIEESCARALGLEFLLDCQERGQTPTFGYGPGGLLRWCEGNIGCGEDDDGIDIRKKVAPKQ